jgi:hypothetical protein
MYSRPETVKENKPATGLVGVKREDKI